MTASTHLADHQNISPMGVSVSYGAAGSNPDVLLFSYGEIQTTYIKKRPVEITARIDYYQKFITHQGLHKGLGVRL